VLKTEPDWQRLPSHTPDGIRRLLRRCLTKDRTRRLADIRDAHFDLDEPASDVLRDARHARWDVSPRWAIAAIAAVAVIGVVIWSDSTRQPATPELPRSATRFVIPLPDGQQFTDQSGQLVAISPDGTNVVYVANQRLYLRPMSGLEARPIPGSEGNVSSPVFSPDGRTVAFYSVGEGALKRVDIAGGAPVTIAKMDRPFGLSWSGPDIVFGQVEQGILRVPFTGGVPEEMLVQLRDEVLSSPQMLPGGRGVLFSVRRRFNYQDHGHVVVQPLDGGVRKTLVEVGLDGRYLPTGHLVYVISGDLFAVPFDLASLSVTGEAVPIVEGIRRSTLIASPATAQFSYSATGSLAFLPGPRDVGDANADLALFDREGKPTPLGLPPRPYRSPRVSPDGKFVAVDIEDPTGAAVWVYELAGGKSMRQLTFGGKNRHPIWSRDSRWVTFQSDRDGDLGIFRQRADGSGLAEPLTEPDEGTEHVPQSWSKDGGQLLFSAFKDKEWTLWTLSVKDRRAAPFGKVHSLEPAEGAFSPDGHWVAYRSKESDATTGDVFLQPFPTTGTKYLVRKGSHVYWSPRGDELFVNAGVGQSVVIPVTTTPRVTFGPERNFPRGLRREGPRPTRREVDAMPDGEHVIGVLVGGGEYLLPQINIVLNWFDEVRQRVPK
jgi:Tol biopolymer transport system component